MYYCQKCSFGHRLERRQEKAVFVSSDGTAEHKFITVSSYYVSLINIRLKFLWLLFWFEQISSLLKGLNILISIFILSIFDEDKPSNVLKHKQVVKPTLKSVFLAFPSESKFWLCNVSCFNSQENLLCWYWPTTPKGWCLCTGLEMRFFPSTCCSVFQYIS